MPFDPALDPQIVDAIKKMATLALVHLPYLEAPPFRRISREDFVALCRDLRAKGFRAKDFPKSIELADILTAPKAPSANGAAGPGLIYQTRRFLPAHWALSKRLGHEAIEAVLALGFDLADTDPGVGLGTVLQSAVVFGAAPSFLVEHLLALGANLHDPQADKGTLMHLATMSEGFCAEGSPSAVWIRALAKLGLDPDAKRGGDDKSPPLKMAAFMQNHDAVEALLDAGAQIDLPDIGGRTALHHAISNGFVSGALILIARGADLLSPDNQRSTPLHLLCAGNGRFTDEKLEVICNFAQSLDQRAIADLRDSEGRRPSDRSVERGELALAERVRALEERWELNAATAASAGAPASPRLAPPRL